MSTFGGLNTALSGLTAARHGLDVVGQNISNATTEGYTRQRLLTSSVGGPAVAGLFTGGVHAGQGVAIDGIARLGNIFLDARVHSALGISGFTAVRANALTDLELSLGEPGDGGLSTQLQEFWAAWQDLSNQAGEPAAAGVVLEKAGVIAAQIAAGYNEVDRQWSTLRSELTGMADEVNAAASQVADLNARIRSTLASGGNANALIDQRDTLITTVASLTGASVQHREDGTVDVLLEGNMLVTGDVARELAVAGGQRMADAAASPVRLEWAHRPGASIGMSGGEMAGAVSVLAPSGATPGSGGALADAAAEYNALAQTLADQVNAIHRTGATSSGDTGLDFFAFQAGVPAALGLRVVPTDANGIAAGSPGSGAHNGDIADLIGQIGTSPDSPDAVWSNFVIRAGVASKTELQQAALAGTAATAAMTAQLSEASVDLDEENVNLLMFQTAYQGAARVMTAIDEMLDTLINRTGVVGR